MYFPDPTLTHTPSLYPKDFIHPRENHSSIPIGFKILALTPLIGRIFTKIMLYVIDYKIEKIHKNGKETVAERQLLEKQKAYKKIDLYHDSNGLTNLTIIITIALLISYAVSQILLLGTFFAVGGIIGVLVSKKIRQVKLVDRLISHVEQHF